MATKNLEDVVAICPKFFDDSTNVDLLKEQIEIYNLGLYNIQYIYHVPYILC